MSPMTLSEITDQWLQRMAEENDQTPDQVANTLLRQQLAPEHAYTAGYKNPKAIHYER